MIMNTKKANGWTKNMIADALEARLGIRLSKSAIVINCSAKDMEEEKAYARHNFIGGVFCIGGYAGVPDAIVYAEREPYDDALPYINYIMIRNGRVSTLLIDEIADAIF